MAEEAAYELWHEIRRADIDQQGALPKTIKKRDKQFEVMNTAIDCAINLYSSCDPQKIRVVTKAMMLLFLHDDVIEYAYSKDSDTILEQEIGIHGTAEETLRTDPDKGAIWARFVRQTLEIDPVWGPGLLRGMIAWSAFTNEHQHSLRSSFSTLSEYLQFREMDVGNEVIIACLRYSCEFQLTPSDVDAVHDLETLMVRHCLLTNDLFSFNKEQCERVSTGASIVNTVECLRTLMTTSVSAAKSMALTLLWEVEQKMHEVYERGLLEWTDLQALYAQRVIELSAGNYFFSATTYRYSTEAIKVHLDFASKVGASL
ncbi:terpene synthase family protein [Aspergillus thermomutatus]|uniref:Terpene synthase n=1 Tax=Aspergillus thermomutatus TaxID=41047 RepID=A0A397GAJ5_ASPTH|nr:uncharacterized protein CDV56_103009 [Aspergillus thermomutatus]RHZ46416.1 hypothetical protein CDV56_103009 [Aspergillus thermomutatus]